MRLPRRKEKRKSDDFRYAYRLRRSVRYAASSNPFSYFRRSLAALAMSPAFSAAAFVSLNAKFLAILPPLA